MQLLVAMAATHVTTLQHLMQRFWMLDNPLLLTLGPQTAAYARCGMPERGLGGTGAVNENPR